MFLCDSSKFGIHSSYKQCELSDVDYFISENDWDYLVDYIQERYNIEFAFCEDVYEWFEDNFMKIARFSKSAYKPLAEQTSNNSNPIIKIRTAIIIDD